MRVNYDGEVKWVPVATAARQLKVTRQRIYQLVGQGELLGMKVDRTWLVSLRSVNARIGQLQLEEAKEYAAR